MKKKTIDRVGYALVDKFFDHITCVCLSRQEARDCKEINETIVKVKITVIK